MAPVESTRDPQRSKTVLVSELKEQLIRACCRYQWMTVEDFWQWLAAVHGSPPTRNHVGKVVSGLAGGGDEAPGHYLFKFALPKTTSGAATRVFVPGTASRELLRQQGGEDAFLWNNPDTMKRHSYSFVYHNLTATRLAIGAALHLREHPDYYLAETLMSYDMLRTPPRLSPSDPQTPLTVIPDLWLHIIADGTEYPLWIEVDRGSESRGAFQRLLRARLLYFKSNQYEEYFGTRHVRLCYAITSSKPPHEDDRLNAKLRWADDVLKKEKLLAWAPVIRVTTIKYETLYDHMPRLFTEPVWYQPDNSSPVVLFSPITTQETPHEQDSDPACRQTGHPSAQNASDHTDSDNMCQDVPQDEGPPGLSV
jgi:hypothetical protein